MMTFEDIAEELGINQDKVCYIYGKAMKKIRRKLRGNPVLREALWLAIQPEPEVQNEDLDAIIKWYEEMEARMGFKHFYYEVLEELDEDS